MTANCPRTLTLLLPFADLSPDRNKLRSDGVNLLITAASPYWDLDNGRGITFVESLASLDPDLHLVVRRCNRTRRGEILGLRWLDIDRTGERLLLPQTKNGEGRIVYLNALAVLDSQVKPGVKPTDPVFLTASGEQVSVAFKRSAKAAKIEDFRFHDLRHTAASWLRMKGADIHTVAQLLGHKDLRMAARYQHLSPTFLSDAVKKLDEVFSEQRAIAAA